MSAIRFLAADKLAPWLAEVAASRQVLAPRQEGKAVVFRPLVAGETPSLARATVSPKAMQQLQENIETFADEQPLNEDEMKTLTGIGRRMSTSVPCTACRYCIEHCPRSLDIPELIRLYNDMVYSDGSFSARNAVNALPADKQPSACIC